jgi:rRNA maturation endonuclease Nob1
MYLIVDTTAIIHFSAIEENLAVNEFLLLPEGIKDEIKSHKAQTIFQLIEGSEKAIFDTPSNGALSEVRIKASESGDLDSLSIIDIQVIALALDYPNSVILSDDNAIQNLCSFLQIPVKPQFFKIKNKRQYFWKCNVCNTKFETKKITCTECGSPLKRYYTKLR